MKPNKSSPTMKDVASEAGVALGTVSKVINGLPVGESYRRRVLEAAEALGYPLRKTREQEAELSKQIGLVLPTLNHPYFALLAEHIIVALHKKGYVALVQTTNSELEDERASILAMTEQNVEGIIALTYTNAISGEENIPLVSIDRFYSTAVPCIASDNFGGGQLAAEKLLELGCRSLLFLRIGDHTLGEPDKREAGFNALCESRNVSHETVHLYDEQQYAPFYDYLRAHFSNGALDFDGICCCTDFVAVSIIDFLRKELGLDVPGDVQVIGFDGLIDYSTRRPYCSSIVQPVDRIAALAVDTLLCPQPSQGPTLTCLPVSYRAGGTTKDG